MPLQRARHGGILPGGTEMKRQRKVAFMSVHRQSASGQAIVEFAIASLAFFLMVFGTLDFGRSIYMYSQLHNAVRDGARYGKLYPTDSTTIMNKVIAGASSFNLTTSNVTVSCTGGCSSTSTQITVSASAQFTAITQGFLGISPITMNGSATAGPE
jgi:Flp pilus assembly protein TadG